MNHGSLFSGIGGFDLAATWMGWKNIFSCEINPFARKILEYYWPNTHHYEDIFELNATQYGGAIDIITGGFPCQPFSNVGRRKGKEDHRYLFPEIIRVIKEARPRWIVLENVLGIVSILEQNSLFKMESKKNELFGQNIEAENPTSFHVQQRIISNIISEIESAGYVLPQLKDGTPIILCFPAAGLNAPHQRDRIWFVAHSNNKGNMQRTENQFKTKNGEKTERQNQYEKGMQPDYLNRFSSLPHIEESGRTLRSESGSYTLMDIQTTYPHLTHGQTDWRNCIPDWEIWPSQSPFFSMDDGVPKHMDGIALSKWRQNSTSAYGNAIVPQIALQIFKVISKIDSSF